MRIRLLVGSLIATVVLGGGAMAVNNARAAKTVKEVMKLAHKDLLPSKQTLLKTILAGSAKDEEKKQLLDLYIDMFEGEPKKGDAGEWKMQAGAAVLSAAKVVLGREGAIEELDKASNCKSCHDKFK